jgi:DNA modification methylase
MLTQQVIQGDCKEVLRSMPNESVDFVLTDPPYSVRYKDRANSAMSIRLTVDLAPQLRPMACLAQLSMET